MCMCVVCVWCVCVCVYVCVCMCVCVYVCVCCTCFQMALCRTGSLKDETDSFLKRKGEWKSVLFSYSSRISMSHVSHVHTIAPLVLHKCLSL